MSHMRGEMRWWEKWREDLYEKGHEAMRRVGDATCTHRKQQTAESHMAAHARLSASAQATLWLASSGMLNLPTLRSPSGAGPL